MTAFEDQAIYPAAELFLIRQFMRKEGFKPKQWLLGTGLSEEQIRLPETQVSLRQFDIIYHNIYRITQRPDIGLALGHALNISRWGILSTALICARTLGDALETGNRFRSLVRSRFTLTPSVKNDATHIAIDRQEGMNFTLSPSFSHEMLIGFLHRHVSDLVGQPNVFSEVRLNYPAPEHHASYEKYMQCPVKFNAAQSLIVIPQSLMTRPLPMGNPVTEQQAIRICELEMERVNKVKKGDLTWMLRAELGKRDGPLPSLDDIADRLHTTPRTLRRKLQDNGTSYRKICQEHQLQLALDSLHDPKQKTAAIAHKCGFRDAASFREAFKRWTDMTPQEYRQHLRTR
ncbi:MAG: AraC family transcriptional regulator [Gammaproteobacteria bacterium]